MTKGLEELPPLREVIRAASLVARKSLGQNYILDLNVTRRIARDAGPLLGSTVLEVGPGPGGLTRGLLVEGAARVIAIEKDERFRGALNAIAEASVNRLSMQFSDALTIDYTALAAQVGVTRVVSNLPYNIATPLVVDWLTASQWPPWYDKLVIMVQQEVGQRLAAVPDTGAYGRLSVLAQLRCRVRILFTLAPEVFTPSPKVFSSLVEIVPVASDIDAVTVANVQKVTAAAFGQRRKMLRSSLSSLGADPAALLAASGIDPTARAEQLSPADFVALALHLPTPRP